MPGPIRIALVGDYNPSVVAHQAIPNALALAAAEIGCPAEPVWIHTSTIADPLAQLQGFDGVWCVPASPYANMEGALASIRFARESGRPFLGTCGGFQHAILEYARNVLGMREAEHAETAPDSPLAVVSLLTCALVEEREQILLSDGLLRGAYGSDRIEEEYHCRFGVNPAFVDQLFSGALRVTGRFGSGDVRAAELAGHPFFVATLFQPERRALKGETPPIVKAFVNAALTYRRQA